MTSSACRSFCRIPTLLHLKERLASRMRQIIETPVPKGSTVFPRERSRRRTVFRQGGDHQTTPPSYLCPARNRRRRLRVVEAARCKPPLCTVTLPGNAWHSKRKPERLPSVLAYAARWVLHAADKLMRVSPRSFGFDCLPGRRSKQTTCLSADYGDDDDSRRAAVEEGKKLHAFPRSEP